MRSTSRGRRLLAVILVAMGLTTVVFVAVNDRRSGQSEEVAQTSAVLVDGVGSSGSRWELQFREEPAGDCVEVLVDGATVTSACGFDIPTLTEVGYGGGLRPGSGDYFIYGLTSARVHTIVAEGVDESRAVTSPLPASLGRPELRFFVIVREPVDNVNRLVALDSGGGTVQQLVLP